MADSTAVEQQATSTNSGDGSEKKPRRHHRIAVAILLVLGFLLTPITMITLFAKSQILDTGRYVQTVKPLASDPAVQAYVADRATQQLLSQVDVHQYVESALPPRAAPLAGPITDAFDTFVHEAVLRVLQSSQFQTVWVNANRAAHSQLVNVLTNERSGTVSTTNGKVTLDLSAIGNQIKQRLESTGISAFQKIPTDRITGHVTLFQSDQLYKARRAVGLLDKLGYILPFVVVAVFGLAIYLSANRRRGFMKVAVAFTLGALVVGIALTLGRNIYLNEASSADIPHDAAAAIFDALVRFLRVAVRAVLTFSIIVVIAAFLAGPSHFAVWFRSTVKRAVNWLGAQSDGAGWGWLGSSRFVVARKRELRVLAALIGFVVLFFWKHPTGFVIFWLAVCVVAALAVIEFYGRERLEADVVAEVSDTPIVTPSGG